MHHPARNFCTPVSSQALDVLSGLDGRLAALGASGVPCASASRGWIELSHVNLCGGWLRGLAVLGATHGASALLLLLSAKYMITVHSQRRKRACVHEAPRGGVGGGHDFSAPIALQTLEAQMSRV